MDNGSAIDREGTDRLEQFLVSDRTPATTMMLDELDGFVTGMVCAQFPVPLERWFSEIWGRGEPDYTSDEQAEEVAELIVRLVSLVSLLLASDEASYRPIYADDAPFSTVASWARGFMRAIAMAPDVWDPVVQQRQELMVPLLAAASVASDSEESEALRALMQDEQMQQEIRAAIPSCVQLIYDAGVGQQSSFEAPYRHTRKTGRNEPCPCGSGRKYKKCCGV